MNINHFIEIVSQLSITSTDRIKRLYMELENIRVSNIEGDLVECGVYRGGNILGMMEYCNSFGLNKKIWLYDTFSGMTSPTAMDKDHNNIWAQDQWDIILCKEGLDQVKQYLSHSSYKNIVYVVGDVCETLQHQHNIPNQIALLRLDTDWFDSTQCELEVLFPKLVSGGSLIIDDYGHWQGCKLATDKYFQDTNYKLKSIDYTGRYLRK
jgi:hypothetical protein